MVVGFGWESGKGGGEVSGGWEGELVMVEGYARPSIGVVLLFMEMLFAVAGGKWKKKKRRGRACNGLRKKKKKEKEVGQAWQKKKGKKKERKKGGKEGEG